MSFFLESEFQNVDEAASTDEYSEEQHIALYIPPGTVPVDRPATPVDESIQMSDSEEEQTTANFAHRTAVPALYKQPQLRDKDLALRRKEQERIEMRECTFQPNIHLRVPECNSKKFLREQQQYETRRKARLESLTKARESQQSVRSRFQPQLNPGSEAIARRVNQGKPLIERLMTPKRKETNTEETFAHHPLISPKARRMNRDGRDVYEDLYRSGKKILQTSPSPPKFVASAYSDVLIVRHFREEFARVCSVLRLSTELSFPQFEKLLYELKFATVQDEEKVRNCWNALQEEKTTVGISQVLAFLESAVCLKRHGSPLPFLLTHKSRSGFPSKFHTHKESWTHHPHLDPRSLAIAQRTDFQSALQRYEIRAKSRMERRKRDNEESIAEVCSFSPKLNRNRDGSPLLKKVRSMSPQTEVSKSTPRYELLHRYGKMVREERRLLPPPDYELQANSEEMTFSPRRYASTSPKRRWDYPSNFEKSVSRMQSAYSRHLEVAKLLSRGEIVTSPARRRETRGEKEWKPVLQTGKRTEEEETTVASQGK